MNLRPLGTTNVGPYHARETSVDPGAAPKDGYVGSTSAAEEPSPRLRAPSTLDALFLQAASSPNPVLASLESTIRNAKHVSLDMEALKKQARTLKPEQLTPANWTFPPYMPQNDGKTVDFFMLMNTINFLFFDPQTMEKYKVSFGEKEFTGADAMVACLHRAVAEGRPILEADYLANISKDDMAAIFQGNFELPLLEERRQIFHEIGSVLKEKYGGSFRNLASAGNHRAFDNGNGIVERLTRDFPSFRDGGGEGEPIFNKRAQLAVGMLASRLEGTGQFECPDVDQLTVFADYQLPRGLRAMGVLKYDDQLSARVDNGQPIEKGSQMEKEVRAFTIVAARLLQDELKKRPGFETLDARGLDSFLWSTARKDKGSKPHVTVTTAY